mmetsp:Transcript_144797/g.464078  ORF Transcript_144797/g.464078 Transcript_144797/m.464078 type:complete len:459 (-) Transcript_144797:233-1609(-)
MGRAARAHGGRADVAVRCRPQQGSATPNHVQLRPRVLGRFHLKRGEDERHQEGVERHLPVQKFEHGANRPSGAALAAVPLCGRRGHREAGRPSEALLPDPERYDRRQEGPGCVATPRALGLLRGARLAALGDALGDVPGHGGEHLPQPRRRHLFRHRRHVPQGVGAPNAPSGPQHHDGGPQVQGRRRQGHLRRGAPGLPEDQGEHALRLEVREEVARRQDKPGESNRHGARRQRSVLPPVHCAIYQDVPGQAEHLFPHGVLGRWRHVLRSSRDRCPVQAAVAVLLRLHCPGARVPSWARHHAQGPEAGERAAGLRGRRQARRLRLLQAGDPDDDHHRDAGVHGPGGHLRQGLHLLRRLVVSGGDAARVHCGPLALRRRHRRPDGHLPSHSERCAGDTRLREGRGRGGHCEGYARQGRGAAAGSRHPRGQGDQVAPLLQRLQLGCPCRGLLRAALEAPR